MLRPCRTALAVHVVLGGDDGSTEAACPVLEDELVEFGVHQANALDRVAHVDERIDVVLHDRLANRLRVLAVFANVPHHLSVKWLISSTA